MVGASSVGVLAAHMEVGALAAALVRTHALRIGRAVRATAWYWLPMGHRREGGCLWWMELPWSLAGVRLEDMICAAALSGVS